MSNIKDVFESVSAQDLEKQVEQLTLQLQDYRMMKEQLNQAQKRDTLASLYGGTVHDLNNILHCILGYTEMALSEKKNGSTDFETLKQIQAIVEKGKGLAQRYLTFGRNSTPHPTALNINTIVEDVERLLLHTTPRNITIERKMNSELSSIIGDEGQCEQVVMNLCLNAMDAMPYGGKLFIKTENIRLAENNQLHTKLGMTPGSYVHLSFADTGIGMSQDVIENIFEPYFTTKEEGRGSGLGLSVVSSIVKSHGGYIHCTSEPDRGSTFDIYLPAVNIDHTEKKNSKEPCFLSNSYSDELILFVDDEEAILNIGKHFLRNCGYNVLTAMNCEEGLKLYQNNSVDLVIMDVGVPDMGGVEFLNHLRSINIEVKVLAISGYFANDMAVRALKIEDQEFLQKPFSREEFLKRVRVILDGHFSQNKPLTINV